MKSVPFQKIVEAIRFEFRRYGFSCDGAPVLDGRSAMFEPEPATGQAAFTKYVVWPYIRIWGEVVDGDVGLDDRGEVAVDLGVNYTHFNRGSNGYAVRYVIASQFMDGLTLKRFDVA